LLARIHGQQARFAQKAALDRLGRPEDIADVVAWLAGDEAR
jgi:NAD(P)-dependent dehydrogenase (short-subunit alcohol dehydrogenase family)